MPWDTTRQPGTAEKYRTPQHRRARAEALAELKRLGHVDCAQPVCVMPTRTILHGEPTHLGHDNSGTVYIGLVHPDCNRKDGAKRGNLRSRGLPDPGQRIADPAGTSGRWAL